MKRRSWWQWAGVAAVVGGLAGFACEGGGIDRTSDHVRVDGEGRLTGAIFTTTEDGTRVDANQYEEKCDVYLNGGPRREGSAGLPEGDYYFMVTGPSGGNPAVLLSTDDVEDRQFHVDETGRISGLSGGGNHDTGENLVDDGVTVQLCPFLDTPNPGCVYKVWVTRVEDYEEGEGTFGFIHRSSKTDNFRVCPVDEEEPDGGVEEEPDGGVEDQPDAGEDEEEDGTDFEQ